MKLRALFADQGGAALVEYALILPAFLAVVLGLMQLGGMAWTSTALNYAVQDAARCAAVRPDICGTSAQVQAFAAADVTGLNVPSSAFSLTKAACGFDVQASAPYHFINSPYWTAGQTLTAEACHP